MTYLAEAMNTYNPALNVLKEMGYTIKIKFEGEDEDIFIWLATKETITISAFNPLSLLALVVVYDKYGENWTHYIKEDHYNKILESSLNSDD